VTVRGTAGSEARRPLCFLQAPFLEAFLQALLGFALALAEWAEPSAA